LNLPDPIRESGPLAKLPHLPRDKDGPVFAEPWQATAFALAVGLSMRGCFTWNEWAEALAKELKADEGPLHQLEAFELLPFPAGSAQPA